ncbi:MAG: hypothetical protein K8R25_04640 [Methanosarcinales archaeon]|nr:hypothetical protein [Methanosarcinales archaeon]
MPDKQDIYRIDKQEAGRDFYIVAGDLVIQHPIKHEPVYIPTIQSVLKKEEISEGEFFRKEPAWVDYKQDYIVERKEVDEIINRLENDKIQLVLGNPASGKSICLKNVGYKLANENKNIYVVELKKHSQDEIKLFFDYIPNIDDDNSIYIIDDAHLYISDCERLIRNFKGKGKGKLIIGSRVTKEITEGFNPTESSELEYLSKTATLIQAEDVTEGMIETFLRAQFNLDEDRIKTVSDNLGKYKKDLWYLSWALKVYGSDNDFVDEDKIYKSIKKRIEKVHAENVFLPLSIFYRFEILIERNFLEEQLSIEKRIINQLIGLHEIVETEEIGKHRMLSLHHSSIAELYFSTYQKFPDFGRKMKVTIQPYINVISNMKNDRELEDIEYLFFDKYIKTTDSKYFVDIVNHLYKGNFLKIRTISLIDNQTPESIKKGIIEENDVSKIGTFLRIINRIGLFDKIKLNLNDVVSLSAKIDMEADIIKIGSCISNINYVSKEMALKLVDSIDINSLSSKIKKEVDIETIGWCVESISSVSQEAGKKLAGGIEIYDLSVKMNKEDDIEKVKNCIKSIAYANKEVAWRLLDNIDINALYSKIYNEEDIGQIGWILYYIAGANEEVALRLVDINVLSSKMDNEEDFVKFGWCILGLAHVKEEIGLNLVDSFSARIDKEENILDIGLCIMNIAKVSKEMALKLVDNVSSRIGQESNIGYITTCILDIADGNKEVAKEILIRLNPKLREEIQKKEVFKSMMLH